MAIMQRLGGGEWPIVGVVLAGVCAGIALASIRDVGLYVCGVILVTALSVALVGVVLRVRVWLFVVFLGAAALGIYVTEDAERAYAVRASSVAPVSGNMVRVTGMIGDDIELRETADVAYVRVDSIVLDDHVFETDDVLVRVFVPRHSPLAYGDRVVLEGELNTPKPFTADNGTIVSYDLIARSQGIVADMFQARVVSREPERHASMFTYLFALKHAYRTAVNTVIEEPYAGLANGIVIGEKRALTKTDADAFTAAGLSHVTVLSGYNVSLVVNFFVAIFVFTARRARYFAAGIGAVLFVAMTGFAAPAVRALIMALVAIVGKVTYNTVDPLRALYVVCIAMLVWNPFMLLHDVSFQLSALATTGLICFQDWYARMCRKLLPEFFVEFASGTAAALTAVAPIIAYTFSVVNMIAPVSNLFVLPFIAPAMALSFVAGFIGMLSPTIAFPVGFFAQEILTIILKATHTFAALPFAMVPLQISAAVCAALYVILFFVASKIYSSDS
jgi:competence protein ComEC